MRRKLGALVFTAVVGTFAAPVFATTTPDAAEPRETATAQPPVAVQRVTVPVAGMRDEAAMVLVGTMLIGLAAAVRRAG